MCNLPMPLAPSGSLVSCAPAWCTSTALVPNGKAPFGGYKQSGNGREWGVAGFDEYLETKAVMGWNAG